MYAVDAENRRLCFFFKEPPTAEIYTLSLHDALPIPGRWRRGTRRRAPARRRASATGSGCASRAPSPRGGGSPPALGTPADRKSTRLNSSHANISYAVFCLKKNTLYLLHASVSTSITY